MDMKVFECKMCGHCCQGQGGIVASRAERTRIAAYLGMNEEDFRTTYMQQQGQKFSLRSRSDGFCIFFDSNSGCSIHPVKPDVCQAWPFFRGNLVDPISWELAQEYCPGILHSSGHREFVIQGIAFLKTNNLIKNGKEDEASALTLPQFMDNM